MPNITLTVPSEIHEFIKIHQEINWSEIARQGIIKQAKKMQLINELVKESKLEEKDIDELDHLIKKSIIKNMTNPKK